MKTNLISIAAEHPRWVMFLIGLATLLALAQLPKLRIEITTEGMMVNDEQEMAKLVDTMQTFGSENVTVIYLEDPDLFSPDNLGAIRQAVQEIENLEQVERTVSLFSIRYLRTVDGFIYTDPYLKTLPQDRQAAEQLVQAALSNPLVERNLLSRDGQVMAVNIYFNMQNYQRGFDEQVAHAVDRAIAPLQERLRRAFHLGNPSVRAGISEQLRADQRVILPMALTVLVITLGLSLRRVNAALIPLLTAGLSVLWILGLMAALNIPLNVMTSIVPALLIIVGSTEDIHLLSEYQAGLEKGERGSSAIKFMAANMEMAVALTFLTTALGFFSIAINRIDLLQQFGMLTALGLFFNFLITVSLVPVSLGLLKLKPGVQLQSNEKSCEIMISGVYRTIYKHRRWIGAGLAVILAVGAFWSTKIQVNNNVMDYFEPGSELPLQAGLLHRKLSGMHAISIVVSGSDETFLQVPYLEALRSLQSYIEEQVWFDKSFSFADFIAVVHSGLNEAEPGEIYLPDRSEVIREYMSLIDQTAAKAFISPDYSQARIIVRHNISSSEQLNRVVEQLQEYAQFWLEPELRLMVTGGSYLNSQAVDYMADGQVRSLVLMLAMIFLLVSFLFMNFKAGLVAVLANLFPIIVLFGVMGYFGFALDTGTAMVGAIALGICVDHTMHFMVRYQRLTRETESEFEALEQVMRQEVVPIVATATALAMGFAVLMFSNFPPVARFGMLSALVMLLALIGTFVVTPLLLRHTRLFTVWDLLSLRLRKEVRKKCPLFANMHAWQVRKLVVLSQVKEYREDEAILYQGDKSDVMHVLLAGSAEVWRTRADGTTYQKGLYAVGDVFGVTSLVSGREGLTDVVAIGGPARVLQLRWESLHGIGRVFPRIAAQVYENLSLIIDRQLLDEGLHEAPHRDEVTGLPRASYLNEQLIYLSKRAARYREPLTLVLFSLEGEAAIDQRYGRKTLHWILREVVESVKPVLRSVDPLGRWSLGKVMLVLQVADEAALKGIFSRIEVGLRRAEFNGISDLSVEFRWSSLQPEESAQSLIERTQTARAALNIPLE